MTRSDLIAALSRRFAPLTAKDAEIAVKEILHAIDQALTRGKRVEICGFGCFALNHRPTHAARNSKSGEAGLSGATISSVSESVRCGKGIRFSNNHASVLLDLLFDEPLSQILE